MIVLKFGGAALANAAQGKNTTSIIDQVKSDKPIVVVSAMRDVTNILENWLRESVTKDLSKEESPLHELRKKHEDVLDDLVEKDEIKDDLSKALNYRLKELDTLLSSVANLRECTPKCRAHVLSFGERFSARGLAGILNDRGIRAQPIDSRQIVRTDSNYLNATVDWEETRKLVRETLLPLVESSIVPVVTGFIGANDKGDTTTLGRGGTDLTAALIANCLDAREVRYYKEVEGFLSADPTIVKGGHHIEHMTFDEVAELSFFGAKILHPIAIRPLREKGIPATLRSFFSPDCPGTLVDNVAPEAGTKSWALTSLKNVALVTVEGPGLLDNPGIAARVFTATAHAVASVLMISQSSSERNICFVVPQLELEKVRAELEKELELDIIKGGVERIEATPELAILCAVGLSLQSHPEMGATVLSALAKEKTEVHLLARGGSLLNLSCLVPMEKLAVALNSVHSALTPPPPPPPPAFSRK